MRKLFLYLLIGLSLGACGGGGGSDAQITTTYYYNETVDGVGDGFYVQHKLISDGTYEQTYIVYDNFIATQMSVLSGTFILSSSTIDIFITLIRTPMLCSGNVTDSFVLSNQTANTIDIDGVTMEIKSVSTAPSDDLTLATCP